MYTGELSGDAIQIVIPKSAYIPQFVRAGTEKRRNRPAIPILSLLTAAVAGAALSFWIAPGLKTRTILDPIVAEAWAPFAKPNNSVLLVPTTPLHLVLGLETHGAYATPIYPPRPKPIPYSVNTGRSRSAPTRRYCPCGPP